MQDRQDPSMEDILASIKKVIAEEKELRAAPEGPEPDEFGEPGEAGDEGQEEVLELDEPLAPPVDLGPPLVNEEVAETSRHSLEQLSTIAATSPRTTVPATPSRPFTLAP